MPISGIVEKGTWLFRAGAVVSGVVPPFQPVFFSGETLGGVAAKGGCFGSEESGIGRVSELEEGAEAERVEVGRSVK